MNRENKRRDILQQNETQEEYGYVERVEADGQVIQQKVDKSMLDMTDRENMLFRYAL
jgi:hypothetical protein